MPTISQTYPTDGNLVIYEEGREVGLTRKGVVVNETVDTVYGHGHVVGKVTATGKYKLCNPSATDGSQNAAGIVRWQANANGGDFTVKAITDTRIVISTRGGMILSKDGIRFGPGFTTQVQKDAAIAQLDALGIKSTVTV